MKKFLLLFALLLISTPIQAQWGGGNGPWILQADDSEDPGGDDDKDPKDDGDKGDDSSDDDDDNSDGDDWLIDDIIDPWENDPPIVTPPGDCGNCDAIDNGDLIDPWAGERPRGNSFNEPVVNDQLLDIVGMHAIKGGQKWHRAYFDKMRVGAKKSKLLRGRKYDFQLMAKVDRTPRTKTTFEVSYKVSWKGKSGKRYERPLYIVVLNNKIVYLTRK